MDTNYEEEVYSGGVAQEGLFDSWLLHSPWDLGQITLYDLVFSPIKWE